MLFTSSQGSSQMDPTSALIGSIVAFLLLLLLLFLTRKSDARPFPPGPRGWELVRVFLMSLNGTLPLLLDEWTRKYGDVIFCPLPLRKLVFLASPSVAKELYRGKSTEKFSNDRPWSFVADRMWQRKCIFSSSPSDPGWVKMRKLMHSWLQFYGDGVPEFERLVSGVLDNTVTSLHRTCGQDLVIKDVVWEFVSSIIGTLLTGEASEEDWALCQAMKRFTDIVFEVGDPSFNLVLSLCPFLDMVPGTGYCRARRELLQSKEDLMRILLLGQGRKTTAKRTPRPGIVDRLREYQSSEGADWMTEDHVQGFLSDIIVAGNSTTTFTINALIFRLLHHPHAMRRIQDELDRVVGPDRKPALSDRPCCGYTEACVLESLRMGAVQPLGLDHLVTQDVELRGCLIPKGTVAFSASHMYSKNPALWTDPVSFKPERFLDPEGRLLPVTHPTRHSLMAFGTGKRSCVGERFARARIFLFLSRVLSCFDILPPAAEELLPMESAWRQGIVATSRLKPYRCRLQRRQVRAVV
ncbi:cytochrome P450 2B1-like [Babylonia areolata]|uniref:cytochrome P450 2B1-like n=1 Tax=Babylonia areolata TaxID=304850 RepID=UPI003FD366C2